jgi:predicted phage-related endonuclease
VLLIVEIALTTRAGPHTIKSICVVPELDVRRQLAEIQNKYDQDLKDAKKGRTVDTHLMESHYSTAMEHLQKLKAKLDALKTELMKKKMFRRFAP